MEPLSAAAAHYSLTFAPERADLGKLRRMGRLPLGMHVQRMDAAILKLVEKERWSAGQLGLFSNDADFLQNGYGLALLDGRSAGGLLLGVWPPLRAALNCKRYPARAGRARDTPPSSPRSSCRKWPIRACGPAGMPTPSTPYVWPGVWALNWTTPICAGRCARKMCAPRPCNSPLTETSYNLCAFPRLNGFAFAFIIECRLRR